jgi:hypothetical protein
MQPAGHGQHGDQGRRGDRVSWGVAFSPIPEQANSFAYRAMEQHKRIVSEVYAGVAAFAAVTDSDCWPSFAGLVRGHCGRDLHRDRDPLVWDPGPVAGLSDGLLLACVAAAMAGAIG